MSKEIFMHLRHADGPRLMAIGGGGFSNGADPALEDQLARLAGGRSARIGYVGAASGDDVVKIERFHARFREIAAHAEHLPMGLDADDVRWRIARLDAVYFGGGNTLSLLHHLHQQNVGSIFFEAARQGLMLAGVSAGAIAWFEWALSDATGQGLAPLKGLGVFKGSCCPHYSSEPERRRAFPDFVSDGRLPGGLAIDDGAAVLLEPDLPPRAFTARAGAWAYAVEAGKGSANAGMRPLPSFG